MNETVETTNAVPGWLKSTAIVGLIAGIAGVGWAIALQSQLSNTQTSLAAANRANADLAQRVDETNDRMKAQGQALAQSVGMTQKQLESKSDELVAAQRSERAATQKLAQEQAATAKQVGDVQTDVSTVKTDVTGVKTDVASTQADLAAAKTQMQSMMGDEGKMSGLIARNHDELEELKHKGDRTYYEFTLTKGAPAQNVGTVKLQLKKVDVKRSKFSMVVSSDDKNIEKKDKNLLEPVQFYSGKSPMLYELVVNNEGKNTVSGYLSVPKGAPAPIAVP